MDMNEYQKLAMRTNGTPDAESMKMNALLGLAGESGELVDYFKKVIYHGHMFDRDKAKNELGDILWYVAQMATALGCDLEHVAAENIDKLRRRYPDKFSSERSVNRMD